MVYNRFERSTFSGLRLCRRYLIGVPEERIELSRPQGPLDFESSASTCFTTPASKGKQLLVRLPASSLTIWPTTGPERHWLVLSTDAAKELRLTSTLPLTRKGWESSRPSISAWFGRDRLLSILPVNFHKTMIGSRSIASCTRRSRGECRLRSFTLSVNCCRV